LAAAFIRIDLNKVVADTHNLELIAYEGGQHLVASGAYQNDAAYTSKLNDANRHTRMQNMYCDYFNYWYDKAKGGMFSHFSSHGVYSKYGSWGVKEFMDDTLSPKYKGLQSCVFSFNSDTSTVDVLDLGSKNHQVKTYPIPSRTGIIHIEHHLNTPTIHLYDVTGQPINFSIVEINEKGLVLDAHGYKGFAILSLNQRAVFISEKIFFSDELK
jgi:hypothetical protein